MTICINDHAYRYFSGSVQKEFAVGKQSEPLACADTLTAKNTIMFRRGHREPWGSFHTKDTVVGVLCPGRTLHSGLELREGGNAVIWGSMSSAEIFWALFQERERHGLGGVFIFLKTLKRFYLFI